ncbi:MAG TPA: cupredoxin domain-containing protein [Methylomirabilota bacterium]|nr:cupredoxin domain-containing protein [Methylomirabilota bacterium]
MEIDKLFIALFSLGGIAFTYWFFLMKPEEKAIEVKNNTIDVIVEGGYSPNVISIPKGKPTTINFFRKDPSSCLEEVVLGDFKIRKYLPLNQKVSITLTPQKIGEFDYTCGMNMFHGEIIVERS